MATTNLVAMYDATSEQVQSWYHHNKSSEAYLDYFLIREATLSNINLAAFELAVEMLIQRHESLRTFFNLVEGTLKQCVVPYDRELFRIFCIDITNETEQEKVITAIIEANKKELKKINCLPLIRCCLFKTMPATYRVCLMLHHIIADEWSMSIAEKEISKFYEAIVKGEPVDIAPLKMQLGDYANWQQQWLRENWQVVHDHWKNILRFCNRFSFEELYNRYMKFSGVPLPVNIRKSITSENELWNILNRGKAACCVCCIDSLLYSRLKQLSLICKCSISTTFNAGLKILFSMLANKEEVLLAMPYSNRYIPGTAMLIGCLGGGIYLHQQVIQKMPVKEFVCAVNIESIKAAQHLIYDHDEMKLDGQKLRIYTDVFVNFVGGEILGEGKLNAERTGTHYALEGAEYYALSCSIQEYQDGILFQWKYNLDLYFSKIIDFMIERFKALLLAMCENSDAAVSDLITYLMESG